MAKLYTYPHWEVRICDAPPYEIIYLENKIESGEPIYFLSKDSGGDIYKVLNIENHTRYTADGTITYVNTRTGKQHTTSYQNFNHKYITGHFFLYEKGEYLPLVPSESEEDVMIKTGHAYLFALTDDNREDYHLSIGYCVDRNYDICSFVFENSRISGWDKGKDNGIRQLNENVIKDCVVKQLGSSTVAKRLRKLCFTYDGSYCKKCSMNRVKGYGDVVVECLEIKDNDIFVLFRIWNGGVTSDTLYRATLADYMAASLTPVAKKLDEQENPLDQILAKLCKQAKDDEEDRVYSDRIIWPHKKK